MNGNRNRTALLTATTVLIALTHSPFAHAQDTVWTRTYGGPGSDFLYAVESAADGGLVAVGSYGGESDDGYLIKFDVSGDTAYTESGGSTGRDYATAVRQIWDSGFIITGNYNMDSDWRGWLIKSDYAGEAEWEVFGSDYVLTSYRDVVETSEHGFIVGGFAAGPDTIFKARMVRYDSLGYVDWPHLPYPSYLAEWDYRRIYGVQSTPDDGFLVAGWVEDYPSFWAGSLWIAKTDANLNKSWEKTYPTPEISGSWGLTLTGDGGSILPAFEGDYQLLGEDVWLVKTDANGDTLWTKKFGTANNDRANAVKQTLDGGYILAGTKDMDEYLSGGNGWLIKTDDSGNLDWEFSFEVQDTAIAFFDVEQITETDYIVVGRIEPPGEYSEALIARITTSAQQIICGDASGDVTINIGDAVYLINYIFKGGPAPDPLCAGDANGDGTVNISDAVYLINYIFKGGPAPVEECCL